MTEVLIIGSGPAGYTAGIYSARAGRKTMIVSGPQKGGQLMISPEIENFPGFGEPISGPELMERMLTQTKRVGVQIVEDVIESVDLSVGNFSCRGESGKEYRAKSLIIATGATARWLGVPGEKQYRGAGVSACATCDGFFFRNKEVAVIGGGNTAVEEALFLTNFASSVTLIHRRDSLRAEKILQKRLLENPKVNVIWNTNVVDILGDGNKVTELCLKDNEGKEFKKSINGVFVAIGHQPATEIFKNQLELDEKGYIVTEHGTPNTSVKGVFAAGDVCDPVYRQAIVSAAQGCMAALEADRFLSMIC